VKLGISARSFPEKMSIPQSLRLARRSSFDAVEFVVGSDRAVKTEMIEADAAALRGWVENISLEVTGVSIDDGCGASLASRDSQEVSGAVYAIERAITICRWLGGDTVRLALAAPEEGDSAAEVLRRSSQALGLLGSASGHGVALAVVAPCRGLITTPREALEFVGSIGVVKPGIFFDVAAAAADGDPSRWIEELGKSIRAVRVRDYRAGCGFVNVLQGDIDWSDIRTALVDAGFDGELIADVVGYDRYPDLGVKHSGESMRRVFKGA